MTKIETSDDLDAHSATEKKTFLTFIDNSNITRLIFVYLFPCTCFLFYHCILVNKGFHFRLLSLASDAIFCTETCRRISSIHARSREQASPAVMATIRSAWSGRMDRCADGFHVHGGEG